ncbi:MAG: hypothetical protein JRN62_02695 [Nitrososphaerota archaeon]|jgi:lysophospholipase L1-like esterase|nr:hypothetical protein [Nitrososphaerota archaeon]MDG6948905.1 hypothetical protein [Nitrososphaerota archaeon]
MKSAEERTIVVFGDSIVMGAWDSSGGWVSRLWALLNNTVVYNLGVDGDTTSQLVTRMDGELRVRASDKVTIVFAIGINDASRVDDVCKVTQEHFLKNFDKLVQHCAPYADHLVIVGLTRVDQSKTVPVDWDPTLMFKNTDIEQYDILLREVSKRHGAAYVPIGEIPLSSDGVHPNSEGHALIASKIVTALQD